MYNYSCSPTLSQISWKNVFGKAVFQILAKIEMMRNKNRLFGHHFETTFYCRIMIFYSAYIYGANFFAKFLCESGFLRGIHGTPLGHQRKWKYLGPLSVKDLSAKTKLKQNDIALLLMTYVQCTHKNNISLAVK